MKKLLLSAMLIISSCSSYAYAEDTGNLLSDIDRQNMQECANIRANPEYQQASQDYDKWTAIMEMENDSQIARSYLMLHMSESEDLIHKLTAVRVVREACKEYWK